MAVKPGGPWRGCRYRVRPRPTIFSPGSDHSPPATGRSGGVTARVGQQRLQATSRHSEHGALRCRHRSDAAGLSGSGPRGPPGKCSTGVPLRGRAARGTPKKRDKPGCARYQTARTHHARAHAQSRPDGARVD
jgi:hypothetical protein